MRDGNQRLHLIKVERQMTRPYGKINKGHTIPYGTLVGASMELRGAYYNYGYLHDHDMPELPRLPIEVEGVDPEEELFKKHIAVAIEEALDAVTPRQKKILCLRFGIGVARDYTLEEVGMVLNLTSARVRQIEVKAIRDMRRCWSRGDKLWDLMGYYETTEKQHLTRTPHDNPNTLPCL